MTSLYANAINIAGRGYHAMYRENEVNRCPGCGRSHWFIGRTLAECCFCATALPLADCVRKPVLASSFSHRHLNSPPARAA